jgi:hypothetical protein
MHVDRYVDGYVDMYVCMYIYTYVYTFIYMYTYLLCIYISTCLCIHIYAFIGGSRMGFQSN